jgi:hypothetical protein
MEELKMIEMMDELLDMINGNEKSKTKLMYVQRKLLAIKQSAQSRVDETESEYAPDHMDPYEKWLENERIERTLNNL